MLEITSPHTNSIGYALAWYSYGIGVVLVLRFLSIGMGLVYYWYGIGLALVWRFMVLVVWYGTWYSILLV